MPSLTDWGPQLRNKGGGDGGKYISNKAWKEDGQLIFWVHPKAMFADRDTLLLPVAYTDDDDEKRILWVRRFHHGDEDVAAKLLDWLAEEEDIDEDEVVLKLKHGKDKVSYTKGGLLGLKGYSFKDKQLNARTESLMGVIPHDDPANQILALPITGGKKVWNEIQSQMKDRGEEGNPQLNPYPLKVTYDNKAKRGSDYYDAHVCLEKLPKEVKALFKQEPHDIEAECDPELEDTDDFGTTAEILQALCVVDCPILNDVESVTDDDEEDEDQDDDTEETEGDDDDDEEEGMDPIEAGEAEEGESYLLEDDTEVCFIGIKRKKAVFEDEDGAQHKLALDADVWPVEEGDADVEDGDEEESEEEDDETEDDSDEGGDEVLVRDAKPGVWYLDGDGDAVKFLEHDEETGAGTVEDEEGDSFTMDGDDTLKKKE